jgi:hypothetical protein
MRNIIPVVLFCGLFLAVTIYAVYSKDQTVDEITAVADDLGCELIEQSYYHPENFYVDCGDDGVQIITVGKQ